MFRPPQQRRDRTPFDSSRLCARGLLPHAAQTRLSFAAEFGESCFDLFLACQLSTRDLAEGLVDGCELFRRRIVDTGAPGLDLARILGEIVLILRRPSSYALEQLFHPRLHLMI